MTRYELVVHVAVDLDSDTPEDAAAVFKRGLRAGVDPSASLLGLAVWRPWDGAAQTPLPSPLPEQLRAFFVGVEESAAAAEAAFRLRVAEILVDSATRIATAPEGRAGDARDADRWESDGGANTVTSVATTPSR